MRNILNWELFLEELVGKHQIANYDAYNQNMQTTLDDKLFFINQVKFDVIVDFGCANGVFLSKIQNLYPNVKIIGYDLDDTMLSKARAILGNKALLTSDWSEVVGELSNYKDPLLNLSSVIHEVYSYSRPIDVNKFWNEQVFGGSFKYITIRDMIPSVVVGREELSKWKDDARKVRIASDTFYLKSFEDKWGSIFQSYRVLLHYLLKYKYTDNWEREVNENYLPVTLETLKNKIPSSYKITFEDSFILPYLAQEVKKDFGIELNHTTHTKLILKNDKFKK